MGACGNTEESPAPSDAVAISKMTTSNHPWAQHPAPAPKQEQAVIFRLSGKVAAFLRSAESIAHRAK
jgi:hypothetical protein